MKPASDHATSRGAFINFPYRRRALLPYRSNISFTSRLRRAPRKIVNRAHSRRNESSSREVCNLCFYDDDSRENPVRHEVSLFGMLLDQLPRTCSSTLLIYISLFVFGLSFRFRLSFMT